MKPKILIILPRGETIRNFIYTDIIKNLLNDFHITIHAIKPNNYIWALLKSNCDELIELKKEYFSYKYRFFFEIYDLAHNRYVWTEAAKVRWNIRDLEANSIKKRVVRKLKKGVATFLATARTLQVLDKIDCWLASKEYQVIENRTYFIKNKFKLVFNTSHSHARIASPLIYAANLENLKTVTFLYSWDNLTSQGRVVPLYDYYFAWNSTIKNDFHVIYPQAKLHQVKVTGTPQFQNHFDENKYLTKENLLLKLGLKQSDRYFLYSSGMSHHMPFEPFVVERIADLILSIDPSLKLIVRTYAKDNNNVFKELKLSRPDIIIPDVDWETNYQTPMPNDHEFFISLMKNCIAGINVASTISLELCLLDKPVINVGYNPPKKNIYPYNYTRFYDFDHYKPIIESGAIDLAKTEIEMKNFLIDAINNPKKNQLNRRNLVTQFFENNSGINVKSNFVNLIIKICNE